MKTSIRTGLGVALLRSALCVAGLAGTAAASAAEIAGNVTLASDYRFRGISQLTGEISPAIQGGFDLKAENGLYLGTWASNVNFTDGAIETDVYGGFAGSFSEDVGYDVGILYYGYPDDGSADLAYWEVYGKLTFAGFTLGLNYSPDYFAETDVFYYPYADYSYTLAENVTLGFHVGYNGFEEEDFLGDDDAYLDWKAGISTTQLGVVWALNYVDTDLDDGEECFGDEDLCAATAVLSITKAL
jgi:uncharacterized protein (TIGR02001 family)